MYPIIWVALLTLALLIVNAGGTPHCMSEKEDSQ
jgi:hypothetical protein